MGETITNPENEPDEEVTEETETPDVPENPEAPEETETPDETDIPDETELPEETEGSEETKEPVEEPAVEPEEPVEVPVESEEPDEITADNAELNEGEEETYAVSISDFESVSALITADATVGDERDKSFSKTGSLEAAKGANIRVEIRAKSGAKITSVMNGETAVSSNGGIYTVTQSNLAADISITVEATAAYKLGTDFGDSGVTAVTLDASLKDAIGAATDAALKITSADVAQGADLKFTLEGTAGADSRFNVSYKADGSGEATPIPAETETVGEGESAKEVDTYTVKQDVLADLHSIEICVEKETKVELKELLDAASNEVTIVYWGTRKASVTEGDEEAWVEGDNASNYDAVTKAYAGDTFKFKAVLKDAVKDKKAITKVTRTVDGEEKTIESENDEYSFTVEEGITAFTVETDYVEAVTNKLTYTLNDTSDEDSVVSAVITKITVGTVDKTEEEEITALLGGKDPSAVLKSGSAVTVKKADGENEVTAIEVTVTPKENYTVKKGDADKHITVAEDGTAVYKFAKTAGTDSAAISEDMKVDVETEVKATAAENEKFFMVSCDKGTEDEPKNSHITAVEVTTETDKVVAVPTSETDATVKAYKVLAGVQTVEFKVTADAGYKLKNADSYEGFKSIKEEAAEEGKVTYTVTLFASKITGESADAPTSIAVEEDEVFFSAEVKSATEESDGNYYAPDIYYYTEEGSHYYYTGEESIPYGSRLTATVEPAGNCHLTSVSYNMGGTDTAVTLVDGVAEVEIPAVTAKVTITVAAEKDYKKTDLTDADDNWVYEDEGVYAVRYDKAYLVGLKNGSNDVPAKDFTAVVKDSAGTVVGLPRITTGNKLKIDLARAKTSLAGQVITIDMVVGDQVVDTYTLDVNKKTTKLTIDGVSKAQKEQRVDSRVEYTIDTDGEFDYSTDDTEGIIEYVELIGNKLVVTTSSMTTKQITKTPATATASAVYHSATITLTSDDDPDLEASITVTAQPFIDGMAEKEVTLSAGAQADTVLNVALGMDGVERPVSGSLYYELTVTPKPDTGTDPEKRLLDKAGIEAVNGDLSCITKTDDSQNYQVQVAKSRNLGEGAACNYEVKAKLTYDTGSGTESTKEVTSTEFATIDGKEIKYVNNLKLVKDKGFKGTLYTGQSDEIVIANVNWSADKKVTYKVLSDDIYDEVKYDAYGNELDGLNVYQNASGQLVVGDVPTSTWLGKHTITVEGTADQSTGHEMYKSRATITVSVVKGIEGIEVIAPSNKIYKKDERSKATLKMTADLNSETESSWDGKKYVTAPKSKNLKWEIVGAGSDEEFGDYPLPDSFGNKAVTINEKNGTINVDKKFEVSKNAANNRFRVKATAADYVGNTLTSYSDVIEITSEAISIDKLALVKWNSDTSKYEVVAVQNKDKDEVQIDAAVADGATVYAVPAGVTLAKDYESYKWWEFVRNKLIDSANYSVTSSSKKVVDVDGRTLDVLAAGKKAKLTVTVNDGSKVKRTLPLNLGWTGADKDIALKIDSIDSEGYYGDGDVFNPASEYAKQPTDAKGTKNVKVKDITSTGAVRLHVQLMEGNKADGSSNAFDEADGFTNYKLAVKGGKFQYNGRGAAVFTTTSKLTTLTLTVGTGRDAKKSVYTITNKAYELTNKAPKVTVKGSLYENGHISEQQVSMTVLNGKDPYGKKAAKIEVDWSSMNAKNEYTLHALNNALEQNVIALDEKTGAIKVSFANFDDDFGGFTPGSYKLKLTVGTGTAEENFKPETLPANVTLKVAKNKAFTFKPQTSYTIGKLDGGAILTGKSNVAKGEKTFMNFWGLENANVDGRPNNFTHYFKVVYDSVNNTHRLVLNTEDPVFQETFGITKDAPLDWDSIDLTKLQQKEYKKDLTGYISYNAWSNKKYYGIGTTGWSNGVEGTVKITVKLAANPKNGAWKPSLKYTANKAEVLAKDGEKAVFNIMSGNEYVAVKHAVIYPTNELTAGEINEKGQVLLTVKGLTAKKTYSTTIKVVPWSSSFIEEIDKLAADSSKKDEYKAAIEKYGIAVKVSVLAKATAEEVTPTPDPVTVAAVLNLIGEKTDSEDGWKTVVKAENPYNLTSSERTAAMKAIQKEVAEYLEGYAPYKGFTVEARSIGVKGWNMSATVRMTVAKGSDIEYFTIPLRVEQGSISNKDKLDNLVKENLEQYKEKIKDVQGVNDAVYYEDENRIVVVIDENETKDVREAFQEWKDKYENQAETEKENLVRQLEETFGDSWENVDSVDLKVNAKFFTKTKEYTKNVIKEDGESIRDYVDKYYNERADLEKKILDKLDEEIKEQTEDNRLEFADLVGWRETGDATVNYKDGSKDLLTGYKLDITNLDVTQP